MAARRRSKAASCSPRDRRSRPPASPRPPPTAARRARCGGSGTWAPVSRPLRNSACSGLRSRQVARRGMGRRPWHSGSSPGCGSRWSRIGWQILRADLTPFAEADEDVLPDRNVALEKSAIGGEAMRSASSGMVSISLVGGVDGGRVLAEERRHRRRGRNGNMHTGSRIEVQTARRGRRNLRSAMIRPSDSSAIASR